VLIFLDPEITYMDAEAGRLIAGFGQRRGLTDALVVFTVDHGETMMARKSFKQRFSLPSQVAG
jgi:arylsulfatase A-like enzyme